MSPRPDPRRSFRLTVPDHLREGELAHYPVHVLNLSPVGACVIHQALLHDGVIGFLDLPLPSGRSGAPDASRGPGSSAPSRPWGVTSGPTTRAGSSSPG